MNSSNTSIVLAKLNGVYESAPNQFMARCPGHDDRTPSLSIRECEDGRLLLHCFAGCDIEQILSALGLTISDILPRSLNQGKLKSPRRVKRQRTVSSRDALSAMDRNALIVAVIGSDILEHKEIDEETWALLANAVERIGAARDGCCPARHRP